MLFDLKQFQNSVMPSFESEKIQALGLFYLQGLALPKMESSLFVLAEIRLYAEVEDTLEMMEFRV